MGMGVLHKDLTLSTRSTGIRPHPKITSPTPKNHLPKPAPKIFSSEFQQVASSVRQKFANGMTCQLEPYHRCRARRLIA